MSMLRQTVAGVLLLLAFTVVLGLGYPLVMTGVGQVAFPGQADGSLVRLQGRDVGSSLIGQEFTGTRWFHSRPSAPSYDALASAGSNLGPNSPDLLEAVQQARAQVARQNGVAPGDVPPDAVTSSGSGLDPHISPAYADLQVARVARARGMSVTDVQQLVDDHTQGRILGFLGEPRVNVLELNLALAAATGG
ncbi:potassium-transporting ATPase subunit KdpC [Nocardioides cynanchi]|uniref:potassium-transporting ATPase subunit KdpC n=1 Tax=Nocardioides cynanchi TaxID=2558918 RepID=UPI0012466226|nr:potassium-transporting ATPase subunit KdpC [Nocardioides cynanchi]